MATKQFAINATTGSAVQVAPNDADRRACYIRNYSNSTVNPGQGTMWVAFGVVATAGTNGELEVVPGAEYSFGGDLRPTTQTLPGSFRLPNCPLESISVITTGGTAVGCVVTQ
jgi:hypothetical protein